MAAWSHRLVKDEDGKLHFAFVRFRHFEDRISGAVGICNSGNTIEDMRGLANELLRACDAGIFDIADGLDSDGDDDERYGDDDHYDDADL